VQAYLPLVIPGILAQTALTACMATGVQLREDMVKGVFDRFRSLPMARIAPLAGPMIADLLAVRDRIDPDLRHRHRDGLPARRRGVRCAGRDRAHGHRRLVAGLGLHLVGTIARSAQSVQGILMMIMFPLTFLSNALVPVDTLPGWLAAFVKVNPVSHIVTATPTWATTGGSPRTSAGRCWPARWVIAIFAPLSVHGYKRHL